MWKKDEQPEDMPKSRTEASRSPERPSRSRGPAEQATIGRSITIKGEVTGEEDLLIQGRVDGSVDLKQHSVTVGSDGEVKADITGRVVTVEGSVDGNLTAEEQVILRGSARVQGDIAAPRVVLEDGARFRGGVDMGDVKDVARKLGGGTTPETRRSPEPGRTSAIGTGEKPAVEKSTSESPSAAKS